MESLGPGRGSVPVVGLGTWRRLEAAAAAGRGRELIDAAINAGIRLVRRTPSAGTGRGSWLHATRTCPMSRPRPAASRAGPQRHGVQLTCA